MAQVKLTILEELPIPSIDLENNPTDKVAHDDLVRMVEQIMQAKAKLAEARNDGEREHFANKYLMLEKSIDETVYRLYDLKADEIKLIENT